ncbi:S41 family peptidase [Pedobacter hartonius]|uniref:Peptidase family S41 n=1 Tax=Pedobacter hartonius TaxID=425514 RepID=A0A1H4BWX0_9SPHI|nr:S41 family peptidase [Pedobacter hartonius]SEA52342.1 Peptidase family S41 [Pedobacter hartonius]
MNRARPLLTLGFIFLITIGLHGQDLNHHLHDLDFLYQTLKKTPGYKDQIKGQKQKDYVQLFQRLKNAQIGPSALDTFYHYSKLFWPIKDMHLGFWEVFDKDLSIEKLKDSVYIAAYHRKSAFKKIPKVNLDLDSLEHSLQSRPADSIEGIYSAGRFGKIGVFRTSVRDSLMGVVLSAGFGNSERGELFGIFKEHVAGRFRGVYTALLTKSWVYSPDVGFRQGMLNRLDLRKEKAFSYAEFWSPKPFYYKIISPKAQYIYLGTFISSNSNLKIAREFYERIKDSLTAPNLIVDLRGNPGGGERCSDQFLKLIKKYASRGRVYVLVNRFVGSNAERFTLALKGHKNVKVYGEITAGVIAYGKNSGDVVQLPSGRFQVYNTDMKDPANYLQYEEVGVVPDVLLNNRSDWINQLSPFFHN